MTNNSAEFNAGFKAGQDYALGRCSKILEKIITCERCPLFCDWVSETRCHEYLKNYLVEQIGEGIKND